MNKKILTAEWFLHIYSRLHMPPEDQDRDEYTPHIPLLSLKFRYFRHGNLNFKKDENFQ